MRAALLLFSALLVSSAQLSSADEPDVAGDALPVNTTKPEFAEPLTLSPSDAFERAKVIKHVDPKFSATTRKTCPEGKAHVRGIVGRDGKITNLVLVSETCKGLGAAYIQALVKWRFKPATVNGKPVAVYYEPRLNYKAAP